MFWYYSVKGSQVKRGIVKNIDESWSVDLK